MEILLIAALIGLLPAAIASNKGRSFVGWWLFGALLFIVALPAALLIKADPKSIERSQLAQGDSKKCPQCAEIVKAEANVCRFCGHSFANTPAASHGAAGPWA